MTDNSPWQSPSGATPPTPPPFDGFAAQPPSGSPVPPPGAWAPPPRPGLIPLAPMTLGVLLSASFRVLRRNPRPVVGFSLIIHAVLAAITLLTTGLITANLLSGTLDTLSSGREITDSEIGTILLAYASSIIGLVFATIGTAILQGVITIEVARGTVGEKLPLRALWARARGRIGVLIGWAFALGGALVVGFVILVTIMILVIVGIGGVGANGGALVAISFLLFFVFGLGFAVITAWLTVKLSLVPSALVLERLGLGKAIGRSWRLVRGFFWRTLGIELLVALMLGIVASIVEAPAQVVGVLFSSLGNPNNTAAALATQVGIIAVVSAIITALVSTITGIVSTSATALIYIDLRIRREGLDLDLMRFIDAREAGDTTVPDPYLPAAHLPVATTSAPPGNATPWS